MYKLRESGVLRTSDNARIPDDSKNKDWQEYQEWTDEGNVPDPEYTLSEVKQNAIQRVKELAGHKIITIAPETQQRNMIAAAIALIRKEVSGSITAPEKSELDAIDDLFNVQVKAIRDASAVIEGEITSKQKRETIEAIDILNHPAWP